jgi:EpsD family peptidyl-prolyl cis-trans isomerase
VKAFIYLLLIAFTLAGCSTRSDSDADGRVAAVVNGTEITKREVDELQKRFGGGQATTAAAARDQRRNVLAGLVRSELVAQQALKKKLDRSPEFVFAMHQARRQALMGAFSENIAANIKPLPVEVIRKIIKENPVFFAQRKLFVYEEIMMSTADVTFLQSLNAAVGNGASISKLAEMIKAKDIQFNRNTRSQSGDQLNPAVYKILTGIPVNRPVVVRVEDRFSMILMLYAQLPIPLEGDAAERAANSVIVSQQRNAELAKQLKNLVDASKIKYYGEFAPDKTDKKGGAPKVALPTADPKRVAKKNSNKIQGSLFIVGSFSFLMLLLSASMRVLRGNLWLPRFWPSKKGADTDPFEQSYKVKFSVKAFLFAVIAISVLALSYQIFWLIEELNLFMIAGGIVSGLLAGTVFSHLFARSPLRQMTRKVRSVPVIVFAILLMAVVFVTTRVIV